MDFAIFRTDSVNAYWAILNSGSGSATFRQFGSLGDIAVPGDYDGDGRDDTAVFRPSIGTWYTSLDPATNYGARQFGLASDITIPADYDGDGKTDIALFRNGIWYVWNSSNNLIRTDFFGTTSDIPIPSVFTTQ